jgi:NADPH:quinone reductase-like Zn-dependent oxidoreductase
LKAVYIERGGQLAVKDLAEPSPAPGRTLIRVKAVGVNFADCMARQGLYPDAPPRPFVPGYEVAGETADGRRVMAMTRFGGYAEVVEVPDDQVFDIPESFSFEEAAGFMVQGLTAGFAMFGYGPLLAGDRVLIQAAAGGVGLCAVQIGLAHGAVLFGTAGSDEKCRKLAEMGVAHPINYRKEDWPRRVRDLGGKLDLVLDSLGGPAIPQGLALLAPGGRLIAFGVAGGSGMGPIRWAADLIQGAFLPVLPLLANSKALIGLNMLRMADHPERIRLVFERLLELVSKGKLRPHIGATFPLDEAHKALELLESRNSVGKVVLTVI